MHVTAGRVHAEPFRFRVTHAASGLPLSGVPFFVSVNVWYCVNPDCDPPDPASFGTFEGANPNESRDLVVASDENGIVASLPLRAGVGDNAYEIAISPVLNDPPWPDVVGERVAFLVIQHATSFDRPHAVPAVGAASLALLALALLATAWVRARR